MIWRGGECQTSGKFQQENNWLCPTVPLNALRVAESLAGVTGDLFFGVILENDCVLVTKDLFKKQHPTKQSCTGQRRNRS